MIKSTILDCLHNLLMQLDLQSVEKGPFSTFALAFAQNMLEIGIPRLRICLLYTSDAADE